MQVVIVILMIIGVKSGDWSGKCSAVGSWEVGSCGREGVDSCGRGEVVVGRWIAVVEGKW